MMVTITLPDELATALQSRAKAQQVSMDELVVGILTRSVADEPETEDWLTLEEVVAQIKATPPNPDAIHPASSSLADLLENAPEDPDFDLETWTQQWNAVETEMKTRDRANDISEGRP